MARARNIATIVDGAHAVSHFPFKLSDLECDYYGTSLHKWTYAPIGTGFLYVRKDRIAGTWSMMASDKRQAGDIRKFEEIGTHPAANHNAISEALVFNQSLGVDRKAARLRFLRDRWAARLAAHPKVRILHSPDPAQSCGIGFLGLVPGVDGGKMREALWSKYNIITTYMPPHGIQRPARHAQRLHDARRGRFLREHGGKGIGLRNTRVQPRIPVTASRLDRRWVAARGLPRPSGREVHGKSATARPPMPDIPGA